MPDRFKSPLYQEDLAYCANLPIHWDKLTGRTIAISGATGMIGTFLIDVLMKKNEDPHFDCRIIAIGRNKSRAQNRFPYFDESHFSFVQMDVSEPGAHTSYPSDIVIHLASTTHPRAYAAEPVSTITSNVIGLQNLLEYSRESQLGQRGSRFIFATDRIAGTQSVLTKNTVDISIRIHFVQAIRKLSVWVNRFAVLISSNMESILLFLA